MKKPLIVVWFSCGAASAVAAKLTVEKYEADYEILVANTGILEEDSDNYRFLLDVEKWIGKKVISVTNSALKTNSARAIWDKAAYMSNPQGAPCTVQLKKEARYQFEKEHNIAFHVMGFCKEEQGRHDRFIKYERSNLLPVLIDAELSKPDCFKIIQDAGIMLPLAYRIGFPNANCIGCVKSTSVTYWNHVRKVRPEVFKDRAEQSRRIGCRLVIYKGKRIFLDELPEEAKGYKMKSAECTIFCETK